MAATEATLTFFERGSWPPHERPYELLFQPPTSDFPVCNYKVTQVPNVPIHDMRPLKGKLSLDREGFVVADIKTSMTYEDYFEQEKLKTIYVPEIKALLMEKLGVRAVYIHECVIRQSDGKGGHSGSFGQPIPNVHTDYTHDYALELIEQLTGDRSMAERIKKSRIQMLNIWKPLRGPLRSWPLALCDLQSLSPEDVITFDEVHTTAVLESQQVVYSPSQKWYYLSDQEPNELIIFKSMDTVLQLLMGPSTTQIALALSLRERVSN
ncbi:putative fad-linked sulfhydryl oxidase alr isoform 2 protein [Aspergillus terreus]|uniref:Putative fad-linked sulfhydryl oxidase alr isoform 2 protein n=1 Tax=Aspergillus terreus TaxID=33178 RepID=A0A5M3Z017_ASPTE|nr:hypothetical protein ATETN484_0005012100 [Aspergillus terreus]GFF16786.1 putative fad-linked sulfhydryl oxidase alr isoform 2 protein [Aspergillus terreus]